MSKKFTMDSSRIERLIPSLGGCIASDAITVSGGNVGYMMREEPSREGDSGWMFMAGSETQEYLDDPGNSSVFEVNTIANYDPEIIPFLLYPAGTEIERGRSGDLTVVQGPPEPPPVRFLSAAKPGWLQITSTWGFEVSSLLLRRLEDGSQVLWRPGFTIWLNAYSESKNQSPEERLSNCMKTASPDHFSSAVVRDERQTRYRYRLDETSEDGTKQQASYCFAFTAQEELHLAIYFESAGDLEEIELIWSSILSVSPERNLAGC
jgi:hypothetical protein